MSKSNLASGRIASWRRQMHSSATCAGHAYSPCVGTLQWPGVCPYQNYPFLWGDLDPI